jgi:hypothetical protein
MRWRRIEKVGKRRPKTGTYKDWKPLLAAEGGHQCVYCALPSARFGGIRNFHVEHYKPKSRFIRLTNSYPNLFYACAICNCFKGDDWPCEPSDDHSVCAYPNPSKVNIGHIVEYSKATGQIRGIHPAAKYLVEQLYLNRPQLLMERRAAELDRSMSEFLAFAEKAEPLLKKRNELELLAELLRAAISTAKDYRSFAQAIPYEREDVSRST